MLDELDHNLTLVQSGIKQMNGVEGMNNRIAEWLATPVGTMAEKPRWGHPLRQYQFDPPGPVLEIEMEIAIVQKIRADIRDITVRGIRVRSGEIDYMHVMIIHDMGIYQGLLNYKEASGG